jgi:hypothetical protein
MKERLINAIYQGRAPHAVLIAGPEGSGRRELARRAAAVFCLRQDAPQRLENCPNYYETGMSSVRVDDVRALLASTAMQGFNGGNRAFVFLDAQNMSVQIQNTLLKTLEEPRDGTMLILTGSEFGLLPTIRSRCMIVRLGADTLERTAAVLSKGGMEANDARFYAALADGIAGRARAYAGADAAAFRETAVELLAQAVFEYAPFAKSAELITSVSAQPNVEDGDDAPRKRSKKSKRGDFALAMRMLDIWQSVFRDALMHSSGGAAERNVDKKELVERITASFTSAYIQGIINKIAMAQQRLAGGANVYLTVDCVLAGLFSKENKEAK